MGKRLSMSCSFVLVHIGDGFISYLINSINQIRKFNKGHIYLIISRKHNDIVRDLDIDIINTEDIRKSEKHLFFSQNSKLDRKFRDGFWMRATERFFYIEDVMVERGLKDVIHIENDTLIYFNVDEYKNVLENYHIAAVFDNDIRCIPCFMYIKCAEHISALTQYIVDMNSKNTDMEIIPLFRRDVGVVNNLPVIPKDYDLPLVSSSGKTTVDGSQYSLNVDSFNSIFDGAALGQYLGGVDPRNKESNIVGFINESSLFDVSRFNIFWDRINGLRIPHIEFHNRVYRINNLHIHSKRLNEFES